MSTKENQENQAFKQLGKSWTCISKAKLAIVVLPAFFCRNFFDSIPMFRNLTILKYTKVSVLLSHPSEKGSYIDIGAAKYRNRNIVTNIVRIIIALTIVSINEFRHQPENYHRILMKKLFTLLLAITTKLSYAQLFVGAAYGTFNNPGSNFKFRGTGPTIMVEYSNQEDVEYYLNASFYKKAINTNSETIYDENGIVLGKRSTTETYKYKYLNLGLREAWQGTFLTPGLMSLQAAEERWAL